MTREEMHLMATIIVDEMERRHSARLAPKWEHGVVVFKPGHPELKQHEMSMQRFMHKVVMMRNAVRVMEQRINAAEGLTDGEKVKLQADITKIYGSMTSFNFMFADEDDGFKGASD